MNDQIFQPGDKVTYRILVLGRETAESGEAVAAE